MMTMSWPAAAVGVTAIVCIAALANAALQGYIQIKKQPRVRREIGDMVLEVQGGNAGKLIDEMVADRTTTHHESPERTQ